MKLFDYYQEVISWYKEIMTLGHIVEVLHWDQRVNLPKAGLERRAEQLAWAESLMHSMLTDKEKVAKVEELAAEAAQINDDAQVNIREIKRETDRATKVPNELVEEISRHTSLSNAAWVEARQNDDFAHFAPFLQKMVELRRQEAAALGFADKPYDAMLDYFEPFADEASIDALLTDLRERLVPFFHKILGAEKHDAGMIVGKSYPAAQQEAFGKMVIKRLGFDFDGGRMDVSAHPFTIGTWGDVRITTRYNESDLRQSTFGTIHEAGHAMYEQGLLRDHLDTPLGQSASLGVHESQSRFWENIIGRSLSFWRFFYPEAQKAFPGQLDDVTLQQFYQAVNLVQPSFIRVEADEVTYNLHIILRFEIERDLVAGRIAVDDLPAAWNAKMKQYLNVDVPADALGVLQDVHWSEGLLGYFPTYTIGNLYSAQLYEKMRNDLGEMDKMILEGNFVDILAWMRKHIHQHGKRYKAADLIERATMEKPSAVPFMKYLEEKYLPLYRL
ncbi:MAG TPA: carboxypeptidase M32 [bacterium]|nr:carboxypeptidase M32 [bacterium]